MRIDILTLFPDAVDAMMHASILGRAQERGYITIRTHQIRSFTTNKQMQVDDYPYGGGRGAVMQADPLYRAGRTSARRPAQEAIPSISLPAGAPSRRTSRAS